jgi:hypothetical protein
MTVEMGALFATAMGLGISGDVDMDGMRDLRDLALMSSHWLQSGIGDLNGDGKVYFKDYKFMGIEPGRVPYGSDMLFRFMISDSSATVTITPNMDLGGVVVIPEPASMAILLAGGLALLRKK